MAERGKFIVLEGADGVGKTTQVRELVATLRSEGKRVLQTREPGGSDLAEEIRRLVLGWNGLGMGVRAEALLFLAARADHVEEVIRPALERGEWVVCDRFVDSTVAYQVIGRGIGGVTERDIRAMSAWACGGLEPDVVVTLVGGGQRVGGVDGGDRIEDAGLTGVHEFFARADCTVWCMGSVEDVARRVRSCCG